MKKEKALFVVRSKIWIEDKEGKVVFGIGRYRILRLIDRLGSMHAAAKELHMSYRAVWLRIRASEERIGKALVIREGKGSKLTPFAGNLVKQFKRLHAVIEAESDEVYDSLMSGHLS
jgi:molybdate transport system regulatory protein